MESIIIIASLATIGALSLLVQIDRLETFAHTVGQVLDRRGLAHSRLSHQKDGLGVVDGAGDKLQQPRGLLGQEVVPAPAAGLLFGRGR